MPSASVTATVVARPLARISERIAMRMSCQSASADSSQRGRQTARIESRGQRDVAEFLQRRQARGFRIFAALDALLDAERHVAADFVVEIVVVGPHALLFAPARPARGS